MNGLNINRIIKTNGHNMEDNLSSMDRFWIQKKTANILEPQIMKHHVCIRWKYIVTHWILQNNEVKLTMYIEPLNNKLSKDQVNEF